MASVVDRGFLKRKRCFTRLFLQFKLTWYSIAKLEFLGSRLAIGRANGWNEQASGPGIEILGFGAFFVPNPLKPNHLKYSQPNP